MRKHANGLPQPTGEKHTGRNKGINNEIEVMSRLADARPRACGRQDEVVQGACALDWEIEKEGRGHDNDDVPEDNPREVGNARGEAWESAREVQGGGGDDAVQGEEGELVAVERVAVLEAVPHDKLVHDTTHHERSHRAATFHPPRPAATTARLDAVRVMTTDVLHRWWPSGGMLGEVVGLDWPKMLQEDGLAGRGASKGDGLSWGWGWGGGGRETREKRPGWQEDSPMKHQPNGPVPSTAPKVSGARRKIWILPSMYNILVHE
eukprot:CAMPEP_0196664746 /NCGR_PEP_ID=MMETSP1086-20130531/58228_1 /TAXON_ID=77921 /ORGANISM="Cyanoptyche  gloeocystis , Strain SAG4.97" /LENGTH=263 /DNA_ID=CAMNT_0042001171 /DNA_START=172 /DNA_END=963 /DNA_ORIENTATION=+